MSNISNVSNVSNTNDIIIRKHAIVRFEQRFKPMINKSMWNKPGFSHMIKLMFKKAVRNGLSITKSFFACIRAQDRLILRTVFKTGNQL